MKLPTAQTSLSILWSFCFLCAIVGSLYLMWIVRIGPKTSTELFNLVIDQFAPFLGAILGYQFAIRGKKPRKVKDATIPFWIAMSLSVMWNLFILGLIIMVCHDADRAPDAIKGVKEILPKLAWVVSPAIGFYFGRPEE